MRVTDGFRAFVLEQLEGVKSVRARAMFGGVGLYADEVFFGILAADTLYLKVDDSNRGQYEAAVRTSSSAAAVTRKCEALQTTRPSRISSACGVSCRTPSLRATAFETSRWPWTMTMA